MDAKLTFSPEELRAVTDTVFFQRKKNITQAIYDYYGALTDAYKGEIDRHSFCLPEDVKQLNGKISRGENYEGLPYIILDFPAFFSAKNIFAVRNLFWWGHGFSQHFLIGHSSYKKYGAKITAAKKKLGRQKLFLCISETPWHHHFRKENYVPVSSLSENDFSHIIQEKKFIKIGAEYSLDTRNLLSRQKKDFTALMQIILM